MDRRCIQFNLCFVHRIIRIKISFILNIRFKNGDKIIYVFSKSDDMYRV